MPGLLAAVAIATCCIAAAEPRLGGRAWPPRLLSAGAGIGLAYLIVHLLPETADATKTWQFTASWFHYDYLHAYVFILVGIFGTLMLRFLQHGQHGFSPHARIVVVQPTIAAALVGYVLATRTDAEIASLIIFSTAIGLHVVISAHALATQSQSPSGGIVLAAAIITGYAIASATNPPTEVIAGLTAVLAGGVMTHVINEVQDEEHHFGALGVGALLETALLFVTS